jgi:serine/threonine protein kinase
MGKAFEPFLYGKYIILGRIAIGGMAEVFYAKSYGVRGFQRLLVIKRILPHLSKDEEFVEMFVDEAKISVELNHANICQVTDLGKIDGNYFIAMEYINGKDLRAILKKCYILQKPIPVDCAIYMMAEVIKGLEYAHKREDTISGRTFSVIHRDMSPQNVMVSYQGDVKIVDFGIAKTEFKLHKTQAGVLKGKFSYMSPEQAMGLELNHQTDIFSAGIILYEMLSGDRLFQGETDFETLEKIKAAKVPDIQAVNPEVPDELAAIVRKALEKNLEKRFQSASDMHVALSKVLYTHFSEFKPERVTQFVQELFGDEISKEAKELKDAVASIPSEKIQAAERASMQDQENSDDQTIMAPTSQDHLRIRTTSPGIMAKFSSLRPYVSYVAMAGVTLLIYCGGKALLYKPDIPSNVSSSAKKIPAEKNYLFISTPEGALVTINNEPKGNTPLDLILPTENFFDVRVEKEGYVAAQKEIQTRPDASQFTFQLEKMLPTLGQLKVTSEPAGAQIFIENEDTGLSTPATIENLDLNHKYKVTLKLKEHRTIVQNVLIDQAENEASFNLEKIVATLKVRTVPNNAQVYLNGNPSSSTINDLSIGKTYTVKATLDGYQTIEKSVNVTANYMEVDLELKKKIIKTGKISISATPWAQVIIDGKLIGTTPVINHDLPVGKHQVVLRHPDFSDVTKEVGIEENKLEKLIIELQ